MEDYSNVEIATVRIAGGSSLVPGDTDVMYLIHLPDDGRFLVGWITSQADGLEPGEYACAMHRPQTGGLAHGYVQEPVAGVGMEQLGAMMPFSVTPEELAEAA